MIPDIISAIGDMMNFTMSCHVIALSRLGLVPVELPANASGKWGGMVGQLMSGDYQLGTGSWVYRQENISVVYYFLNHYLHILFLHISYFVAKVGTK